MNQPFLPFDDPDFDKALIAAAKTSVEESIALLAQAVENDTVLRLLITMTEQRTILTKTMGEELGTQFILLIAFLYGFRTANGMPRH